MTNNLGKTSISITIVTHSRHRSNYFENALFIDKQYNAIIRSFRIKVTKHLKHVFLMSVNVNVQMHIATCQMIRLLCCVSYDKNQSKT